MSVVVAQSEQRHVRLSSRTKVPAARGASAPRLRCATCARLFASATSLHKHQTLRQHGWTDGVQPLPWLFDFGTLVSHKTMFIAPAERYFASCSNSFVKIFSHLGLRIWLAQAATEYSSPDWKIHLAVHRKDLRRAFDIVSALFVQHNMPFAMKGVAPDNEWSEAMSGREITLYLFRVGRPTFQLPVYDSATTCKRVRVATLYADPYIVAERNTCSLPGDRRKPSAAELYELPTVDDDVEQYRRFLIDVERELAAQNVRRAPNGCADGDTPIPGAHYASLRNERFIYVADKATFIYPPNAVGANGSSVLGVDDPEHKRLIGALRLDNQQ
jgi:hypothetical protein